MEKAMKSKRIMSYFGKVIWWDGTYFMVARGDHTDEIFDSIEKAMRWIENNHKSRKENK